MRVLVALAALAACQATLRGSPTPRPDADDGTPGSGSSMIEIATFTPSSPTLTGGTPNSGETGTITFTATVTGNVAGGALDDDTGLHYVAFMPGAGTTYTATLTWAIANQVLPIEYAAGTSASRTFVAKFTGTDGSTSSVKTTISFACRDSYGLDGACGGTCTNTKLDVRHCGGCQTGCPTGDICGESTCRKAQLAGNNTECLLPIQAVGEDCDSICAAAGGACNRMTGFTGTTCAGLFLGYACSHVITDMPNVSVTCNCG